MLYLNSWISTLKKSSEYIFSLLDDVVKASNFILDRIMQNKKYTEKVGI